VNTVAQKNNHACALRHYEPDPEVHIALPSDERPCAARVAKAFLRVRAMEMRLRGSVTPCCARGSARGAARVARVACLQAQEVA